jgi:hypothetical protein
MAGFALAQPAPQQAQREKLTIGLAEIGVDPRYEPIQGLTPA